MDAHDAVRYNVTKNGATERPFTGKYLGNWETGRYCCHGCGQELFDSGAKFDAGCGWPSFTAPVSVKAVALSPDDSLGMSRTEVTCAGCGAHLGHVFDDGPEPALARYCVNSASLRFSRRRQSS